MKKFFICSGVVQHSHSRSRGASTTRSSFKSVSGSSVTMLSSQGNPLKDSRTQANFPFATASGVTTPVSSTQPLISEAGVTSNAGL